MNLVEPVRVQQARALSGGTAVIGLQFGDEGKGKIVHLLSERHDAVARFNGGANAGHSVVVNGERFALHLIPSGILHRGMPAIVGNGVVVDPEQLLKERAGLEARGVDCSGLVVSDRAHVVMPWHKAEDEAREKWLLQAGSAGTGTGGLRPIGTTKRGIGPCYADKVQRATAIRMGDLLRPETLLPRLQAICPMKAALLGALAGGGGATSADGAGLEMVREVTDPQAVLAMCTRWGAALKDHVRDTSALLLDLIDSGKRILFEGANATLLDVDHGTYPFVTSSACAASGIPGGAGVPMSSIGTVLGVCKAYTSRVGGGPMPTELAGELAERIRTRGREFGTTTGRPRRVGWLDLVSVRYAARLNGATGLCVMLLDVLAGLSELKVCVAYDGPGGRTEVFPPDGAALDRVRPIYHTLRGFGSAGGESGVGGGGGADIGSVRRLGELPAGARAYLELIERFVGVPIRFVSVGPDRAQTIEIE